MPRINAKRRVLDQRPFVPADPAFKAAAIERVKIALASGTSTIEAIAADLGIERSTLTHWMLGLGEEYHQLRQQWIDAKLAAADDAIESSRRLDHLARARERWKSATWFAERRDPARYGQRLAVEAKLAVLNLSFGVKQEQRPMIDHSPAVKPDKPSQ